MSFSQSGSTAFGRLLNATFLLVVLLAYALSWRQAPYSTLDTPSYVEVAHDVRDLNLSQAHQRTPGFPLLLVLTDNDRQPTRLFFYLSLALHFSAVAILAWVLEIAGVGVWGVRLFLVAASLPPFVEWTAYLATETLSEFLVVATVSSLVAWIRSRRSYWIVLACLCGTAAAFTRPTFQAIVVVLVAGVWGCHMFGILPMSRRQLMLGIAAALVSVGLQASYAAVNYKKFGYFGTNTFTPYALSAKVVGVVEYLPAEYAAVREILVRRRDELLIDPRYDHTGQNYIYRALPELVQRHGGNQLAALQEMQRLSVYLIIHKPMSYLGECLKAIAGYWMPTDGPLSTPTPALRLMWAAVQLGVVGVFFLQALALTGTALFYFPGLLDRRVREISETRTDHTAVGVYILCQLVIWYTMVISCAFGIGLARYRSPTELLILGATMIGFRIWSNASRESGVRREQHSIESEVGVRA